MDLWVFQDEGVAHLLEPVHLVSDGVVGVAGDTGIPSHDLFVIISVAFGAIGGVSGLYLINKCQGMNALGRRDKHRIGFPLGIGVGKLGMAEKTALDPMGRIALIGLSMTVGRGTAVF